MTPKPTRASRGPLLAAVGYVAALIVLIALAWSGVSEIMDRRDALAASADLLAQLEGRKSATARSDTAQSQIPTGSPFLEGQTLTVAGAALLQRVADAVTKVGGSVVSSQVDVQGVQAKDGYVTVLASCELDHTALQRLLYDLEAGMPFLFVEQVVAQAPQTGSVESGRMRLLLSVAGRWGGEK
jgi:general secretion pathway protein M